MATQPSHTVRNVFRAVGVLLLLGGLFFVIRGGMGIADEMNSSAVDGGFGPIGMLAGGGFMIVFGIAALNVGTIGAQADYVAGQTSGAVRTFGSAFRGDSQRVTEHEAPSQKLGKFCSECGVRNGEEARFCDACGHALATA